MRIDEIRNQIDAAIAEELRSHGLRAYLLEKARLHGGKLTDTELTDAIGLVVEYIMYVPTLLAAIELTAARAGLSDTIEPVLDVCEKYWFEGMDIIPDHLGLVGYLDDAYYVLSILQAIDTHFARRGRASLLAWDFKDLNQTFRAVIGEPHATQLDAAIVNALQPLRGSDTLERLRLLNAPLLDEDRVADRVRFDNLDALVHTRIGVPSEASGGGSVDEFSDSLGVPEPPPPPHPTHAKPPEPAATPPPSASRIRSPGHKKLDRARPRRHRPPVSTGFATRAEPGAPLSKDQPIVAGEKYYFWLEVGEVVGAIDANPVPLRLDLLPAKARLVVVLFAADGGFCPEAGADLGELELRPDGTVPVTAQPAKRYQNIDAALLKRRLLFPLRAPAQRGEYRLRCSIYCIGVLVESRLIEVQVGGMNRVSRVDYSLTTKLDPGKLQALGEHRFSMMSNHRPGGDHDFYIYGGKGKKPFRDSVTIPRGTLSGALEIARAALRRASWGDEEPWDSGKKYRYDGKPKIETLSEDLAVLAIAGWRIYDLLANQLAGGKKNLPKLTELVRKPGLVQISPDASLGMVLPAALIYDYKIKPQAKPAAQFALCAEFERAYRAKTPLQETACFQGQCPSNGQPTTVCPSGFWGFRHGLGLPISDVEEGDERETEFDVRLEYQDIPVIVVGVSRAPDLPRTRAHTEELQALRPDWGRGWLVEYGLDPVLEVMRSKQPHVVYLYCHGSGREVGKAEIPMLYLGDNPQAAKPGEWLERSMLRDEIEWTKPRPLVFLNGCHTTVLDAQTTLDFVTGFVQNSNACGVVGTEVTVFEPLAGAFATRFMERFLGGAVVGQAIRDARLDLLREGNPLGLVYTPFVLSGTQLVRTGPQ